MKADFFHIRFSRAAVLFGSVTFILGFTSCAQTSSPRVTSTTAIVSDLKVEVVNENRPSAFNLTTLTQLTATSPAHTQEVTVTVVVDKAAMLSQEFLYGADLQYSSLYDSDMDLYNQSLAIGHIPAKFRIVDQELQLVADNKRLYPSEVNHPEQLISRFKILSQSEKTLTLSGANSAVFLGTVFEGTHTDTKGGLTNPAGAPPRDSWIRSFEFAPQGNYLLQQTSVILADGSIGEFMEAIFPRSSIAPGDQFEKFEMDPENPTGGDTDVLSRFRFLGGEHIFDGEKKLSFAQHFDISKTTANPDGTIDWYATGNISDEQLIPVKEAVEGWNRYFSKFKGIERQVVRFKGRLPEGIHIGDPRFNVINWDSRLVAGAAYESQATDPQTGKQSHSLIYMPAAWLQIGFDYWKNGQYSDQKNESVSPEALARHGGLAQSARLACMRDLRDGTALAASGRLSADEIKEFGVRLLKGTLFHEVGHALGLNHNFKGSLSFDRSKPESIFSASIMDYNDYEIERGAFPELRSSEGPQLEYDRQALSAIYNKTADIAETDAVVPACNDDEADNEEGGVDPLCIRYDLEKDPTLSISTALDRINLSTKKEDVTLAQSLTRIPALVLTSEALSSVKNKEELKSLTEKLSTALKGSIKFYIILSKASLSRVVRTNVKSLLQFTDDVLPEGYNEREMRERAFTGVQKALAFRTLPDPVTTALTQAIRASVNALATTPYMSGLGSDESRKLGETLSQAIDKAVTSIVDDEASGLPKVRAAVLASLARHKKVPFFYGKIAGSDTTLDFEASIVGILGDAVTASEPARTKSERVLAATALSTYRGRPQGDAAIGAVDAALAKLRAATTDNASRELVEALILALKPAQGDDKE